MSTSNRFIGAEWEAGAGVPDSLKKYLLPGWETETFTGSTGYCLLHTFRTKEFTITACYVVNQGITPPISLNDCEHTTELLIAADGRLHVLFDDQTKMSLDENHFSYHRRQCSSMTIMPLSRLNSLVFVIQLSAEFLCGMGLCPSAPMDTSTGRNEPVFFQDGGVNGKLMHMEMANIMGDLLNYRLGEGFQKLYIRVKIIALLLHANRQVSQSTGKVFLSRSHQERILRAHAIVEQEFSTALTLEDLARQVGINSNMLKKGFKQIYGKPFFEIFIEARMGYAKRLLRESKKTVEEIAFLTGYNNASNFCLAFSKFEGCPPGQYRKGILSGVTIKKL